MATRCIYFIVLSTIATTCAFGDFELSNAGNINLVKSMGDLICSYNLKGLQIFSDHKALRDEMSLLLKRFSDCNLAYITTRKDKASRPFSYKQDETVLVYLLYIMHDPMDKLQKTLVMKKSAAKHLTHVLLIVEQADAIGMPWLRQTFEKYWQHWVLNVAIIYWRHGELHVYRYTPFGVHGFEVIRLAWRPLQLAPGLNELYPREMLNMRRRKLRFCLYPEQIRAIFQNNDVNNVVGSDGFLSKALAQSLNASRVVHRVDRFRRNTSKDICVDEVANAIDDIAMNLRFLTHSHQTRWRVEYTMVLRRDDMCVLVPKAKSASKMFNLLRFFSQRVRYCIWAVVLASIVFCVIAHRCARVRENLWLQLFSSMLTMSHSRMSRRNSIRCLIVSLFIYSTLISTVFNANLMTNLIFFKYEPDLNTIEDLAHSPYEVLIYNRHYKHAVNFMEESESLRHVLHKLRSVPDKEVLSAIAMHNVSFAYMQKYHVCSIQAHSRQHYIHNRPVYHLMQTCLVPHHAAFAVTYGSPYLGYINRQIRRIQEFGLSTLWEHVQMAKLTQSHKYFVRSSSTTTDTDTAMPDNLKLLTLRHFRPAFVVLVGGLMAATLTFLAEFIIHRRQRQN